MTSRSEPTNQLSPRSAAWLIRARGQWLGLSRFPWHRGETDWRAASEKKKSRELEPGLWWSFTLVFVFLDTSKFVLLLMISALLGCCTVLRYSLFK